MNSIRALNVRTRDDGNPRNRTDRDRGRNAPSSYIAPVMPAAQVAAELDPDRRAPHPDIEDRDIENIRIENQRAQP
jgi:hypothetical protein